MAALIYLADPENRNRPHPILPSILLDSGGEYWFLHRYFESANLDRRNELIDLYGGAVIEGYQLHRLQTELELALEDTNRKPDSWHVLVGWSGDKPSVETEDWQPVTKSTILALIESLLRMVRYSTTSGLKLMSSGD